MAARRGTLTDRNGKVLAEDRLQWDLVVRFDRFDGTAWTCDGCGRPAEMTGEGPPRRCPACRGTAFSPRPPRDLSRLPGLLGIGADDLAAGLARARDDMGKQTDREIKRKSKAKIPVRPEEERARFAAWWWRAIDGVPPEVVKEVELHPDRYHGLSVDPEWRRVVADGTAGALVGRLGRVYAEERPALEAKGYSVAQIWRMVVGRTGLEHALEDRLAAREGLRRVYRNLDGELVTLPGEIPAKDGESIRLALDADLTERAAEALAEAGRREHAGYGAFVAMDVATGDVLALASWSKEESGLFFPVQAFVPGSVFKTVSAIAGLESGAVPVSHRFLCTGSWHGIGCHEKVHGDVDVVDALAVSCNGFFAEEAGKMGILILDEWANTLGFDRPTGIDLPGEAGGLIPDPLWKEKRHEQAPEHYPYKIWFPGDTRNAGFGQGDVLVTPLQVARLMAIVGNGGRFVRPSLVAGEGGLGDRVVSAESIRIVQEGLRAVVTRGTATRTGLDRFRAAGKTGTADLPPGHGNAAWFAGYAPAEAPRVAFACVLAETPRYGADAAAPVVSAFLEGYFAR